MVGSSSFANGHPIYQIIRTGSNNLFVFQVHLNWSYGDNSIEGLFHVSCDPDLSTVY